jgi:putative CocE/NonD family hydrolase
MIPIIGIPNHTATVEVKYVNVLFVSMVAAAMICGAVRNAMAQSGPSSSDICAAYEKSVVMIPMRDGVKLYTEVYRPKQATAPTGILLDRTPYMTPSDTCSQSFAALFDDVWQDGYILVRQSVRGRNGSEGTFELGAPLRSGTSGTQTDEATDAWDTTAWLVQHVTGNNGRVGMVGASYDAKLALMAASDPHPALVAVSAQASPIDQWLGDDFWRSGAFRLNYCLEHAVRLDSPRDRYLVAFDDADTFDWYLKLGPLENVDKNYLHGQSPFWTDQERHSAYDEYWRTRNLAQAVQRVHVPVLTTGGWWDAEDFYGSMEIGKILNHRPAGEAGSHLIVGPWTHGGWIIPAGTTGRSLGEINFGSDTAHFWRHEVERPWLAHWILGKTDPRLPPVLTFRTGANEWVKYNDWPPQPARGILNLYLSCDGTIRFDRPDSSSCRRSYVSDPANPVPYLPRPIGPIYGVAGYKSPWGSWQAQDQRFASQRPDVLLFKTAPLTEEVVLTGEAELKMSVTTTGTDGDFIVKLLDIFPGVDPENPKLGGYYLMLSHVIKGGRYLKDIAKPRPLVPGRIYPLSFHFDGNDHAYLKGHAIGIQIQSTLFPVIARNPQRYVSNIFEQTEADFQPAKVDVVFGATKENVLSIPRN